MKRTPQELVDKMLNNDHFSKWLGLRVDEIKLGYCSLHFKVQQQMLNGFHKVHGGILFAAADSAFAFASNTHDNISVALDTSISYTKSATEGDLIKVVAQEEYSGNRTGVYTVKLWNQNEELLAIFKGTVYRTKKQLP